MPSISPEISLKVTNLLKTMGKLSDPAIVEAKKKYDGNGKAPLGVLHYLIEDKKVTEDDIIAAISRNYALRKIQLTEQSVKKEALAKLPKEFIQQNEIIPFDLVGKILKVAIFDPTKSTLASKMKSMTGCNIEIYVAKPSNIESAKKFKVVVEALKSTDASSTPQAAKPKPMAQGIKIPGARGAKPGENDVVSFVDSILLEAFHSGTSDIHIEPYRRGEARLRFRKDGVLQEQSQFTNFLMEN